MTSRITYNNPRLDGSFGLPYHYELLSDRSRLHPFRQAITLAAKGRRVLESGIGSGVLSIFAARAGAEIVYATERDHQIAAFARHNITRSGYSERIRIIEKDTCCITLQDIDNSPVDLVIAEHLSTWQVTEPQIHVMNYINENLATQTAIRIPGVASNRAELAYSRFSFEDSVELRTIYFGFTGIRKPRILSLPAEVKRVPFDSLTETSVKCRRKLRATQSGLVNSLRLTSPLVLFRDIRFHSSDSLVPPVIVPLQEDIDVSKGDRVELYVEYEFGTDWNNVICRASAGTDVR